MTWAEIGHITFVTLIVLAFGPLAVAILDDYPASKILWAIPATALWWICAAVLAWLVIDVSTDISGKLSAFI